MENDYYKCYEPFFGSWYIKRFIGKGSYDKRRKEIRSQMSKELYE